MNMAVRCLNCNEISFNNKPKNVNKADKLEFVWNYMMMLFKRILFWVQLLVFDKKCKNSMKEIRGATIALLKNLPNIEMCPLRMCTNH